MVHQSPCRHSEFQIYRGKVLVFDWPKSKIIFSATQSCFLTISLVLEQKLTGSRGLFHVQDSSGLHAVLVDTSLSSTSTIVLFWFGKVWRWKTPHRLVLEVSQLFWVVDKKQTIVLSRACVVAWLISVAVGIPVMMTKVRHCFTVSLKNVFICSFRETKIDWLKDRIQKDTFVWSFSEGTVDGAGNRENGEGGKRQQIRFKVDPPSWSLVGNY